MTENLKILAIDPSTSTGWALYQNGIVTNAGYILFTENNKSNYYRQAYNWITSLIKQYSPDYLIIEDYFFGKSFATGSNIGVELRGVLKMAISDMNLIYHISNPSKWKKILLDKITPNLIAPEFQKLRSAESKIARWKRILNSKYGKIKGKKIITVLALEYLGLKCPEKIKNPITGKKIGFRFDVSDAIGILIGYLIENNINYTFDVKWDFEIIK